MHVCMCIGVPAVNLMVVFICKNISQFVCLIKQCLSNQMGIPKSIIEFITETSC